MRKRPVASGKWAGLVMLAMLPAALWPVYAQTVLKTNYGPSYAVWITDTNGATTTLVLPVGSTIQIGSNAVVTAGDAAVVTNRGTAYVLGVVSNTAAFATTVIAAPALNTVYTNTAQRSLVAAQLVFNPGVSGTALVSLVTWTTGPTTELARAGTTVPTAYYEAPVLAPLQPAATFMFTNLSVDGATAVLTNLWLHRQ